MMDFPDEHKQFQCLLSATATQSGTLGEMLNEEQSETVVPLPPVKRIALNDEDHSKLTEMYKTLLPNCEVVSTQRLCDSFSRVQINGAIYRCSRNYGVLAKWFNGECRPGRVCRFLTHDVVVKQDRGKRQNLLLCSLRLIGSRPIPKGTGFQTPLKYGVLILKVFLKCLSFQLKEFTVNV